MEHARNVAIVLLLAAGVAFLPGGGTAAHVVIEVFSVIFLAGLAFFAYRLYMEHRLSLLAMRERDRLILYASLGLGLLALSGTGKLWDSAGGRLAWFAMLAAALAGLYSVYVTSRQY